MTLDELDAILSDQIRVFAKEDISLNNKLFSRQTQKSKELANLAGKKIAITAQQLYANELGAHIAIPSLGIEEGGIYIIPASKVSKMLQ